MTNQYVVQCTHTYVGAVGTTWTAVLKITDTNTGDNASSTYPVLMAANALTSNVNVAIDEGLWYLHSTMHRYVSGALALGDWYTGCAGFACQTSIGTTATNIQAFEVNQHLESGPAADPYTEDVARGIKGVLPLTSTFNPGTTFNVPTGCSGAACTSINPDPTGLGLAALVSDAQGNPVYQGGMIIDMLVATSTPNAVAVNGPSGIAGKTYKNIVQEFVNGYVYCVQRSSNGGGWRYGCPADADNSVCQWAAIGIIAGVRGFGVQVDPNLYAWNKVWLNLTEGPGGAGVFGYGTTPVWGPYATTPSGMVQLAMDGVGRGDSRWDLAETFIRDNFGNAPTNNNVSLKAYFYGLFSFTKSMLLHDPGGVLTPITLLKSATPGVPPIDWYAAEVTNGAPTDGVARWLVSQQNPTGYWYNTEEVNTSAQWPFSTGFAIIMLRKTVFTACVTDLNGKGTPSGRAPARIDLTWSALSGADHYTMLRGTTSGGPYSILGTATIPAYSDTSGLANGGTYYYVLQPDNSAGIEICQSNEKPITIPAGGR